MSSILSMSPTPHRESRDLPMAALIELHLGRDRPPTSRRVVSELAGLGVVLQPARRVAAIGQPHRRRRIRRRRGRHRRIVAGLALRHQTPLVIGIHRPRQRRTARRQWHVRQVAGTASPTSPPWRRRPTTSPCRPLPRHSRPHRTENEPTSPSEMDPGAVGLAVDLGSEFADGTAAHAASATTTVAAVTSHVDLMVDRCTRTLPPLIASFPYSVVHGDHQETARLPTRPTRRFAGVLVGIASYIPCRAWCHHSGAGSLSRYCWSRCRPDQPGAGIPCPTSPRRPTSRPLQVQI